MTHFYPNFGAEEDADWSALLMLPFFRRLSLLWSALAGDPALIHGLLTNPKLYWPVWIRDSRPIFPWLGQPNLGLAWLMTSGAWESLRRAGGEPFGASPEEVAQVHDKAFCRRIADEEQLDPPAVRGLFRVYEPEELADAHAFQSDAGRVLASWPAEFRERWALRPRFSSSGRGRVPGFGGAVDVPEVRGALKRLRAQGGAILEPVYRRLADVSASYFVDRSGGIEFLGTLDQQLSVSGSFVGHSGLVKEADVSSAREEGKRVEAMARRVVERAAAKGYWGPCGVDAFVMELGGMPTVRLAEINARWTVGIVTIGLLRRMQQQRILGNPRLTRAFALDWSGAAPIGPGIEEALLIHDDERLAPRMLWETRT
jgi:hypothetical protein